MKLELLQHTGSFKPRGAFNRLLTATPPTAGVVAASGGNHGAAVAYAARSLGITAEIFVPTGTPAAKLARLAGYGARVVRGGDSYAEALIASRERQAETGALEVHAYDDFDVLAGQGTVGWEFEQDAPNLTHVLVASGGGGLIGGIAAWYAGSAEIISVEPEACPCLHDALLAGQPTDSPVGGLAADSLGARRVGALMFPVAKRFVSQAVLVPDEVYQGGATGVMAPFSPCRRTGWRHRRGGATIRTVSTTARRSGWRGNLWGEHRPSGGGWLVNQADRRWSEISVLFGRVVQGRIGVAQALRGLLGDLGMAQL